mmetsp:Transcript_9290/g.19932  ORF Transcript_9290/g.19932 Transcript_9290/m.19932 type:complete len:347 (+) Transcript_9290:134-1174(+)
MAPSKNISDNYCDDCKSHLGKRYFGLFGTKTPTKCHSCSKQLCSTCAGNHTLMPFEEGNEPPLTEKSALKSYCDDCFQKASILDYSRSYDVIEATNSSDGVVNLLFAHGGGSTRAMFRPHARILSSKGYRCILFDMPGHGTLVRTTLTLDECSKTVKEILEEESCVPSRTIYIGASFGAYIGFHILSQLKDKFSGAILLDCGQNVGPDCSLKARIGLYFMRKFAEKMTNKAIMETMLGVGGKSKANYHLVECCYASGMFFEQGARQCDCLHAVAPAKIIPDLDFPIQFFNGAEDHRDSEDKWLSLCKDQERSVLKTYEEGDHFFCHDDRFVADMLERMDEFIKKVT